MKPPVRMVCRDCLRSAEFSGDDAQYLPKACPFCGKTLDSQSTDGETVIGNRTDALPGTPPGEATPWVEAWSKGTLGTLGRFQLRERLGGGGFGEVFLAYDPRLDRDVALKVLKLANPDDRVVQRFFREARAAARLDHPNIVTVHDAGHDDGRCWIAYQYVAGRALSRPRDRRMDVAAVARLIRDLADALDHAHRQEVFHRDLKPANILVDDRGRPHLTDFGLARRADLDSDLTRDGAILGTPAYMSPEQAGGRSHLADERSDVYSLGVIFFELLCGRRPVDLPSGAPAWLSQAREPTPSPRPRAIDRTIPAALDRICSKTLDIDPEGRYPSARALAADLDRWLDRRTRATALWTPLICIASGVIAALLLILGLSFAFAPAERSKARGPIVTPRSESSPAPPPRPATGAASEQPLKHADTKEGSRDMPVSPREAAQAARAEVAGAGVRNPFARMDTNSDGKISRDEFTGPEWLFERIDADGDGVITREEAAKFRASRGAGPGGVQGFMSPQLRAMDEDGDGRISREEFTGPEPMFDRIDADKDGFIIPAEARRFFRQILMQDSPEGKKGTERKAKD